MPFLRVMAFWRRPGHVAQEPALDHGMGQDVAVVVPSPRGVVWFFGADLTIRPRPVFSMRSSSSISWRS